MDEGGPVFDRGLRGPAATRGPRATTEDRAGRPRSLLGAGLFSCGGAETQGSGHRTRGDRSDGLSTQAQPLDDRAVAVDVLLLHVVEQPPATPHEQQQATTRVVVVLVLLEVLGQVRDPVAEQRD